MGFLLYDYYSRALNVAKCKPGDKMVVLLCTSWESEADSNVCGQYGSLLVKLLQKEGYEVEQACGSLQEDFQRMVHARVLVSGGAGSSLSYMAALASKNTAVIPTTIAAPGQRPSMDHHRYQTRPGLHFLHDERLPHSAVKDYNNVKEVHELLLKNYRSKTENNEV